MRAVRVGTGVLAAACVATLGSAGGALAASAGPPTDYTKVRGLSKPRFDEIVQTKRHVKTSSGIGIYIEVTKPEGKGPFPVILEASPYHGTLADREGRRILPDPVNKRGVPLGLTGYFAPRGYAVVMMDLRGTGRSRGCLDHLGTNDRGDLHDIVEWAAERPWSNGRVGMTGHSYVGATPSAAAAMRPKGLKTIVPSAGLATMYDHQFHAGVPFFLQWVGTMEAYEQLAIERKLPPFTDPFGLTHTGDDFPNHPEETPCGLPQSSLVAGEDQLSGRYAPWHAERDWREQAERAPASVFMVQGVNDNAARATGMQWFTNRGKTRFGRDDKLWLGQWDHGSGCCPNRRGIQWTKALHAWFDRELMNRDVDTGPPVELFLSNGSFVDATTGKRTEILTRERWPGKTKPLAFHPTDDGKLSRGEPAEGEVSFQGDPAGFTDNFAGGGATFTTGPVKRSLVMAGVPRLKLAASATAPRMHLIATLFDVQERGETPLRRRISQCAINPELRESEDFFAPDEATPIVAGERFDVAPPCFAMAHHLRKGHELVLRVTTSDPDKVPVFAADPNVTVFTGPGATSVRVPVVRRPQLYRDRMRLQAGGERIAPGPAQPGYRGSTMPLAPGGGARVEGVSSEYFEFEVKGGFDNARMLAEAAPAAPADIDLYLQRAEPDGGWSDDLTDGGSASLEEEQLETDRLEPGRYRLETHLWAGPPATSVDVAISFFNRKGEPGGLD